MGSKRRLDSIDRQIIAMLAHAPQTSNRDIATALAVAESTISVRVDALIRDKIMKLSVQQNIMKAGHDVLAWIDVSCAFSETERIAEEIKAIETVISISQFFENPFLQAMVFARNATELRGMVETIGSIAGVDAIATDVTIGEACIKPGIASL